MCNKNKSRLSYIAGCMLLLVALCSSSAYSAELQPNTIFDQEVPSKQALDKHAALIEYLQNRYNAIPTMKGEVQGKDSGNSQNYLFVSWKDAGGFTWITFNAFPPQEWCLLAMSTCKVVHLRSGIMSDDSRILSFVVDKSSGKNVQENTNAFFACIKDVCSISNVGML